LVHGLSATELSHFSEQLKAHQSDIGLPMLVPLLLLEQRVRSATTKVRDSHEELVKIENQTEVKAPWLKLKETPHLSAPTMSAFKFVDFDSVTRDITSVSAQLAYVEYVCEVHMPMLDLISDMQRRLLANLTPQKTCDLQHTAARLYEKNRSLHSSLEGTLFRVRYLSKRGQVQVQHVRQTT
jgi:hypothetical protein